MEGERVSFGLDGFIELLHSIVELVLSVFRPVVAGLVAIAGEGPIGLLVVFVVFFAIFLARTAAKTKNAYDFGIAIMGVGRFGMKWTVVYTLLLFTEVVLLPLFVFIFIVSLNSIVGNEPGMGRIVELLSSNTLVGAGVISDLEKVYANPTRYVLPLGWRATMLIFACFGCMHLVGRTLVGAAQNS